VVLLVEAEKRPPRFRVLADDLLGDRTAENPLVFAFERASVSVPDALGLVCEKA
jgi:hypothetical protein